MRKFINLLRYDGANSSLNFILFTISEFLVLSNILLVFLNETDNVEKCVLAAKDFVTLAYFYTSMYKRFQQPQAGIRLTETIEEEYLIDCYRLDYNEQKWRDIKQHYENNRSHLEQTGRLFNILTISCMAGITTRYAIFDLAKLFFGGRSMRGKPTPFVAYIPPDVDQTDFLVYIFVLQVFLTAILHMEGYFINCALFQCSQKILTNFEAMYIIIDHIAENYPSSSSLDFYDKNIEQARNNGFFNTDNARTEKLREDMRLLVRSHQHLNRSVKSCVKCFEYGILALSVLISMDTCSLFYSMLQAESNIIVMSYLLLCSTYTTLLLLVYYIGQRVTNQIMKAAFTYGNIMYSRKST
ncbi:uncharacterized protein LOC120351844 isoform X2 [Nilaparvata lugens]|uniref:uncharacterized protein LOC120351844 isoform X2 n=1 Tax=Nilaparvata lugens TaxID=108931 RepID=UPI00193E94AA|nr:uncharacterized protein LOC120351844 isoform X2 [Nilaparvata lugens]